MIGVAALFLLETVFVSLTWHTVGANSAACNVASTGLDPIGSTKYLPLEVYNENECEKLQHLMYFPADEAGICTRTKWPSSKSVKAAKSGAEIFASSDCSGEPKTKVNGPCAKGYKLVASDGPMLVDLPGGVLLYTHFSSNSTHDSCQKKQAFVEYWHPTTCRYSHDDPDATYIQVDTCTDSEVKFSQFTDKDCKTAKVGNLTAISEPLTCTVSNCGKSGQFSKQAVCSGGGGTSGGGSGGGGKKKGNSAVISASKYSNHMGVISVALLQVFAMIQ